jgi:hypothetical protein
MPRVYVMLAFCLACTPDGKPPLHTSKFAGEIGGTCAQDSDCHGSGSCMTTKFAASNVAPPGGYCTRSCAADSDCGNGKCVQDSSDHNFYCMAACDSAGDCRADYLCLLSKHCEPFARYNPSCDPQGDAGQCANGAGGCARVAIGTGLAGLCLQTCDSATSCPTGEGCYYLDENANGDPFRGGVCINPAGTLPEGSSCSSSFDCQSFHACVTPNDQCLALCTNIGGTCTNGLPCLDFAQPGPFGYCSDGF